MFTGMMLICAPFYVSKKVFLFERKILSVILLFFPVVSMIAMYCYLKGINAFAQEGVHIDLSFSAIYYHPMWLAPIAGLANVILLWCLFQLQNKCFRCIVLSILLLSIYVTVVAASRTALFASVITMVLYIVYNARNVKKIILYWNITGTSIREWTNQPHKHFKAKNQMLLDINNVFSNAAYLGTTDNHKGIKRVVQSHIFEVEVSGEKNLLIVREYDWGEYVLHSISDSPELYNKIKKE